MNKSWLWTWVLVIQSYLPFLQHFSSEKCSTYFVKISQIFSLISADFLEPLYINVKLPNGFKIYFWCTIVSSRKHFCPDSETDFGFYIFFLSIVILQDLTVNYTLPWIIVFQNAMIEVDYIFKNIPFVSRKLPLYSIC